MLSHLQPAANTYSTCEILPFQANLDVLFAPEFNMPEVFKAGPGDVAKIVCREVLHQRNVLI